MTTDQTFPLDWPTPAPPPPPAHLELGQPVIITDRLIRAELTPAQVLRLADEWEHVPAPIVAAAEKVEPRMRAQLSNREHRVWIPASTLPALGFDVRVLTRAEPRGLEVALPRTGITVQQVQLQDGRIHYDYDDGATFIHAHTSVGYRIAYSLHRRPIMAHPTMVEPTTDTTRSPQ